MQTISLKLSDAMAKKLILVTQKKGVGKSELLRSIIHDYLAGKSNKTNKASFFELTDDLCDSVKGPRDLSANPKYFENFGK
jgi:hypothetical protein